MIFLWISKIYIKLHTDTHQDLLLTQNYSIELLINKDDLSWNSKMNSFICTTFFSKNKWYLENTKHNLLRHLNILQFEGFRNFEFDNIF